MYSSAGYADLKNINENPQENKDIAYAVKAGQTYEVLYLLLWFEDIYFPNLIKNPIYIPGITISPNPRSEHFYLGLSKGSIIGIKSLIGASIPVATSTITD